MSHFIDKSLSMSLEFLFPPSVFDSSSAYNLLLKREINLTSKKIILSLQKVMHCKRTGQKPAVGKKSRA
jgi:hypothetical protein